MPVEEQVVAFIAGTRGYLDSIPVVDVKRFEGELLSHFRTRHPDILDAIRTTGSIADEAALEAGVKDFAELFAPTVVATVAAEEHAAPVQAAAPAPTEAVAH